jgi:hypothetical protein
MSAPHSGFNPAWEKPNEKPPAPENRERTESECMVRVWSWGARKKLGRPLHQAELYCSGMRGSVSAHGGFERQSNNTANSRALMPDSHILEIQ